MIVWPRRDRDNRVVPEEITPGCEGYPVNVVAVTVREFVGGQIVAESQGLEEDGMVAIWPGFQIQEQPGRARGLVPEAAAHAHRHVEFGGSQRADCGGNVRSERVHAANRSRACLGGRERN